MKKQLVWFGPPYSYSGYAMHNRAMIFELHKLGWEIRLIPTEDKIPDKLIGKNLLLSLVKNTHIEPRETICINLVPPPALPYYGKYNILFTTLESKTVHEGYYRRCQLFNELWFPCLENVKSMKKANWPRKRIFHCPEGVYSNFWTNDTIPNKKYKSPYFTFFYNGDWSFRKGIDTLVRAYAKAFSPTDPVRLLLLVHYQGNGEEVSRQVIGTEIKDICDRANITRLPRIEFIFGHVPDPEMPGIFKCANVYVCPTRGEAWGLPIIQAMSCGAPAIVPDWGGQIDYCNKKNSFLIKTEKFDTIHDKVNLEVDFYRYQQFCFPDENHLIKLMQYSYQHPDEIKRKGQIASDHVRKNFSWTNSARIAERRLIKIYETKCR